MSVRAEVDEVFPTLDDFVVLKLVNDFFEPVARWNADRELIGVEPAEIFYVRPAFPYVSESDVDAIFFVPQLFDGAKLDVVFVVSLCDLERALAERYLDRDKADAACLTDVAKFEVVLGASSVPRRINDRCNDDEVVDRDWEVWESGNFSAIGASRSEFIL